MAPIKRPKPGGPNDSKGPVGSKTPAKTGTRPAVTPSPVTPSPVTPVVAENNPVGLPVNDPNSASNIQAQADAAQKLRDEANQRFETNRDNAIKEANRRETIAAVKGIFASYGLDSLYAKIESYAKLDYSASTVSLMLRETPEYAIRFPAMKALNAKQRGITEAEYIAYESSAAAYEVQYGLPKDMLKNNITGLLEAEISSAELLDRIQMASASSVSSFMSIIVPPRGGAEAPPPVIVT